MTTEEVKEAIRKNIKWSTREMYPYTGGQSTGVRPTFSVLESEELGLKIEYGGERSQFKNREMCAQLFELAMMEIIK